VTPHALLDTRHKTHGEFRETARHAQAIRWVCRGAGNWEELSDVQREALDNIAGKIARILSGDPGHPDHWVDIQGYAGLALQELPGPSGRGPRQLELDLTPPPRCPTVPAGASLSSPPTT
jgi:hypothetical protein